MSTNLSGDEIINYIVEHLTEFPKHKITISMEDDGLDFDCSCHYIKVL